MANDDDRSLLKGQRRWAAEAGGRAPTFVLADPTLLKEVADFYLEITRVYRELAALPVTFDPWRQAQINSILSRTTKLVLDVVFDPFPNVDELSLRRAYATLKLEGDALAAIWASFRKYRKEDWTGDGLIPARESASERFPYWPSSPNGVSEISPAESRQHHMSDWAEEAHPPTVPTTLGPDPGPMAINWDIDKIPTYTGSPQSKARALIAAKDHGPGPGPGPRGGVGRPGDNPLVVHGPKPFSPVSRGPGPLRGPTGGPGLRKDPSPNPSRNRSATPTEATSRRDSSNEGKGVSASAREAFGVSVGVSGRSGSPGGVSTGGVERGVSIDKSQERAAGTRIDKSQETRTELGIDGSSLRLVDSSSGKTLTSYQAPSEKSPAPAMAEDTTPAEKPPDPEDDAEASRKQKGGGGSMPNPEDSGGGEGPRTSGVRVSSPNPENTGRAVGGALQVPARLRYAALPNPESRVVDDAPDWLTSVAGRTLEARTFLGRLPGARNYGGPDGGYRPADDTTAGGGTGGPRAYDAYPDPESGGGSGPRARYERPNPEDTNSPHGPGARNREGIAPWSASRNRMV